MTRQWRALILVVLACSWIAAWIAHDDPGYWWVPPAAWTGAAALGAGLAWSERRR